MYVFFGVTGTLGVLVPAPMYAQIGLTWLGGTGKRNLRAMGRVATFNLCRPKNLLAYFPRALQS